MKKNQIVTALVENRAGVLNRVTSLLRRRMFNIESLTVGVSEEPGLSRMTIVIGADTDLEQVRKQLYKIVEVISVNVIPAELAIVRDLLVAEIGYTSRQKENLSKILKKHGCKKIAKKENSETIELVGSPDQITDFLKQIEKYKIISLAHTGSAAICK